MVADAAAEIGDPQVRNRGTLGGSLAHADPSADYPAVMLALDADIDVRGRSGSRVDQGERVLQGSVYRRSGAGRDHHRRAVRAGEGGGVRQAPSARVALRDCRRRRRARRAGRDDSVGARRADRRRLARGAARPTSSRRWPGSRRRRRPSSRRRRSPAADVTDDHRRHPRQRDYRRAMIPVFTRRALQGAAQRA